MNLRPKELNRYVEAVLELKRSGTGQAEEIRRALDAAFTRIYRTVAFDIDGTLTLPRTASIDPQAAKAIGRLLQRGVPVILTTGRGGVSSIRAARQIRDYSGLSNWYMRHLQCFTDNGCYLRQTPIDEPEALLSLEKPWVEGLPDLSELADELRPQVARHPEMEMEIGPYAVRMTFRQRGTRSKLEKVVRSLAEQLSPGRVFISHGRYADRFCLDLAVTHKQAALEKLLQVMKLPSDAVLRLGDHGDPEGNDYHLLASAAGFSVGTLSPDLLQCYPVLAADMSHRLKGSAATVKLLSEVFIFALLSIDVKLDTFAELREFERIALTRSRQEKEAVTQRVRVRLRYMMEDPRPELHYLDLSDIFDDQSGGVRFREWELELLHANPEISELFDLPSPTKKGKFGWCMYTDTGILMRGPKYYFGETATAVEPFFERFLDNARGFVRGAIETTNVLSKVEVDLVRFKVVLAIQDNVRNILLQLLHVLFVVEGAQDRPRWSRTRRFFRLVAAHSEAQYRFLLNPDAEWATVLPVYSSLLRRILRYLSSVPGDLTSDVLSKEPKQELFKWRECDNFLQNVAAVQLGLHELRQQPEIREATRLLIIGLVYGGIELPGIALAIARARGFKVACGLLALSIYSDEMNGDRVRAEVRAGTLNYVQPFLEENRPFCLLNFRNRRVKNAITIVMDDNCTTCLTLQVARDVLVTLRADVAGAVVVRFAGMNRHAGMAKSGYVPDPKGLFSFVRGLVAPSPQVRMGPGSKDPCTRDPTKAFDKGRQRIERYLKRNRKPVLPA